MIVHSIGANKLKDIAGIMLVMVSRWISLRNGCTNMAQTTRFPDFAAREFLQLLSRSSSLTDVPFLRLSNCDAYGLDQFYILQQGCRAST